MPAISGPKNLLQLVLKSVPLKHPFKLKLEAIICRWQCSQIKSKIELFSWKTLVMFCFFYYYL